MAYQDIWATCTKCGKKFVFRVESQRRQVKQGEEITPPALCSDCRDPAPPATKRPERQPRPSKAAAAAPAPAPAAEQAPKTPELGAGPHEGTVKWYDSQKGYGFIIHANGEEIFFHRTGIAAGESPRFPDDVRVTYLLEQTDKGPQAVDVAKMEAEDPQPPEEEQPPVAEQEAT